MENTAKLLSTQCMPRSLFPKTLKADPEGGGGVVALQDWLSTGVPVQPEGEEESTVRVCVPFWQVLQALYVYVQADVEVHDRVSTGRPVHPFGEAESTVRVWVPFWQVLQAL